jgi:hypothetical protein
MYKVKKYLWYFISGILGLLYSLLVYLNPMPLPVQPLFYLSAYIVYPVAIIIGVTPGDFLLTYYAYTGHILGFGLGMLIYHLYVMIKSRRN